MKVNKYSSTFCRSAGASQVPTLLTSPAHTSSTALTTGVNFTWRKASELAADSDENERIWTNHLADNAYDQRQRTRRLKRLHPRKDQVVRVRLTPQTLNEFHLRREVWHYWHSLRVVCPTKTAREMLHPNDRGKACPLCGLSGLDTRVSYVLPVVDAEGCGGGAALLVADLDLVEALVQADVKHGFSAPDARLPYLITKDYGQWRVTPGRQPKNFPDCYQPLAEDVDNESGYGHWAQKNWEYAAVRDVRVKAVEGIATNLAAGNEPDYHALDGLMAAMPGATFVSDIFGTKHPLHAGWQRTEREMMQRKGHIEELRRSNICLMCGWPSRNLCTFDIDSDEGLDWFLRYNRWAKGAQLSKGRRGGNVYFRVWGGYPREVIHYRRIIDHNPHKLAEGWGEFRGAQKTTIAGAHPTGVLYQVTHLGEIPTISFSDIQIPQGVAPPLRRLTNPNQRRLKRTGSICVHLLENVIHRHDGSLTARCPACAEVGEDKSGEHFWLGQTGAFGCARHPGEGGKDHRRSIWRLVGMNE